MHVVLIMTSLLWLRPGDCTGSAPGEALVSLYLPLTEFLSSVMATQVSELHAMFPAMGREVIAAVLESCGNSSKCVLW